MKLGEATVVVLVLSVGRYYRSLKNEPASHPAIQLIPLPSSRVVSLDGGRESEEAPSCPQMVVEWSI